jgi:hypothetical protein
MHGVLGFRSGADEVSILLGYGVTSVGVRCPTFRDSVVVSTSKIGSPTSFNFRPLKCRNTGHPTPSDVVTYTTETPFLSVEMSIIEQSKVKRC